MPFLAAKIGTETGSLEDFMFRKYSPGQGRWISPDPAGLAAVDMTNPQTWNRYAYVANNPLSFTDPLGLQLGYCTSSTGAQWDDADSGDESDEQASCQDAGGSWSNYVIDQSVTVNGDNPGDIGTLTFEISVVSASSSAANKGTTPSPYSTGCTVAGSGGPTANTHGFSHCTVTVGQNGKYTAYDGGPTGSIYNSTLQVQSGPGGPPGPNTFYLSDSCSMAGCVPRVAQQINNSNMWYSFPFQNSNTAAGMMLNQCGANVSLPVWGPQ